jgi:tetratricopeptide (TPR) repeat protein
MAHAALGHRAQAIACYRDVLKINPNMTEVLNNLAWLLATEPDDTEKNGAEAISLARRGCEITKYQQPGLLGTLGAAYAQVGRFDDAVAAAERARVLWTRMGNQTMADANENLLKLFRDHRSCRVSSRSP